MIFSEMPEVLRYSRHIYKLEQSFLSSTLPWSQRIFLIFHLMRELRENHEALRCSLMRWLIQENPLGPGYLNETPQNIYIYIWIPASHPPSHGLYAT